MEPDKVHVLAGDIGGSFGLKIGASREELAVAAASRALGRPVKWVEDRSENLAASGQAREEGFDVLAAVSEDGDLRGLDVKMVLDNGAYPVMGTMVPTIIEGMLPGPYKLAAMGFESTAVATNKASYIAYRGPWASETFVRERVLDLLAKDLGLDPLEIRLRNMAPRTDPPFMMVTGRPLAGVTSKESLERVAQMVDIPAFRRRQARTLAGSLPGHRHGDLHRGRSRPALPRSGQRPDGLGVHAAHARGGRHRDAVHRPDAARAEPPDHPRPDRR
jgi:carbon-monoxide dehydrogenase large subunit